MESNISLFNYDRKAKVLSYILISNFMHSMSLDLMRAGILISGQSSLMKRFYTALYYRIYYTGSYILYKSSVNGTFIQFNINS